MRILFVLIVTWTNQNQKELENVFLVIALFYFFEPML